MELSYNLTPQDLKWGLLLHERRPKGVLAVVRKAERLFFLLAALAGGCLTAMLLFLLARGAWEEDFSAVLSVSGTTLVVSLLFLALLSPRRRAARGFRMLGQVPDYLGPRTLALEPGGVAAVYGPNRRVEPYAALQEVWERRGFVLLYLKGGLWEVVPPCAFRDEAHRRSFLAALEAARAGRPPEDAPISREPEAQAEGAPAVFTLSYAWEAEELRETLLQANLAYVRSRFYWRPVVILGAILSLPATGAGVWALAAAIPSGDVSEIVTAAAALVIGLALCLFWAGTLPPMVRWAIRRQEKKDVLRHLLAGPVLEQIGPDGVESFQEGERERTPWSLVVGVRSADWGLALIRRDHKLLVFPARAFGTREEQDQAAAYARERISRR